PLSVTIASNATNFNLWNYLVANGFATAGKPGSWSVTIASGILINASSTGSYAFDTRALPVGSVLQITNKATIPGPGGRGRAAWPAACHAGNPGAAGGPALHVQVATTFANNGNVWGGGGGGGAGASGFYYGGGGGGGAGSSAGAGGSGGSGPLAGQAGSPGSLTSGGSRGGGGTGAGPRGGGGGRRAEGGGGGRRRRRGGGRRRRGGGTARRA